MFEAEMPKEFSGMGIFLIFGSASAMASGKTAELVRALENQEIEVDTSASPSLLRYKAEEYTHILLITDGAMPPMADMWATFFKSSKNFVAAAFVKALIPLQFKKTFKFEHEWKIDDPAGIEAITQWAKAAKAQTKENSTPKLESANSNGYESVTGILRLHEPMLESSSVVAAEARTSFAIDTNEVPSFRIENRSNDSAHGMEARFGEPVSEILNIGALNNLGQEDNDDDIGSDIAVDSVAMEPTNQSKSIVVTSLSLASGSEVKDLSQAPVIDSLDEISETGNDSQTSQVVKRYALLKEKENREKQKTIDILRSELDKAKSSQHGIQSEKRKLMLKVDEIEADRRALQETVDELRHKVSMSDNDTMQKIRDYQTRLENSQFLAKRLEKKLEDFKLRVRLDIQKIRARERELENRLELQKRDAESLISAKDTRLLNQKREIDRLQFEMEILKERLVEETERAEDRNEKLQRAVQSLKMAQGMLSGIDEEVISTSERQSGDGSGGEAA